MRILILSDLYPPSYLGGHELRCKIIADEFEKLGHEVFVLTGNYGINDNEKGKNIYRELKFLHHLIEEKTNNIKKRFNQLKIAVIGRQNYHITRNIVRKVRPDIVYAGQLTCVSLFPVRALKKENIPVVHHVGNYYLVNLIDSCILEKRFFKRSFNRFIYGLTDLSNYDFSNIITVSNFVKDRYMQAGLPESSLKVIHPRGIPLKEILDEGDFLSKPSEVFNVLYVGRIVVEKGVEVAIQAIDYLVNKKNVKNINFDIIGGGVESYVKQLQLLVRQLGLSGKVNFRGKLSHDEVAKEYSKYHVLVVPSVWDEPFGIVVVEGMACGVSVVASSVGGIVDIIENGKDGILVPPGDPIVLGDAVFDLIQDQSKLKEIAINSIKKVKKDFSNEKIVSRILKQMEKAKKGVI